MARAKVSYRIDFYLKKEKFEKEEVEKDGYFPFILDVHKNESGKLYFAVSMNQA